MGATHPQLSVIVPALDEEELLATTLQAIGRSAKMAEDRHGVETEVIVVDNGSTDRTVEIALEAGATVVSETERNIGRVRNRGACTATGDTLVFIDADTLIPEELLARVQREISASGCIGGAFIAVCHPSRWFVRKYLDAWRVVGRLLSLAQGAAQFCRRDAFMSLGGYDETIYMGEDTDLFLRLRALGHSQKRKAILIKDVQVQTSARRFDQWPIWKVLWLTNPIFILATRRMRFRWSGWYENPPR